MIWHVWWAWVAFGIVLAIIEVLVPGFIFLGFAFGALAVGLVLVLDLVLALPWLLVIFALVSLLSWVILRAVFGIRRGQVKIIEHDINEQ